MRSKNNKLWIFILIILILVLSISGCRFLEKQKQGDLDGMRVHFIDIGQGHAVLIETQGKFMLIDGGDKDRASDLIYYLKKQGVKKLDYMIASHYDTDHLNGLVAAMNQFECRIILSPTYKSDSRIYSAFQTRKKRLTRAREIHPEFGDVFSFGDANFTIVCPINPPYEKENDNSIGIRIVYGERSFLICADAQVESEKDMELKDDLILESDVYLANHHGSKTSSNTGYLSKIKPSFTVISCGLFNSFGHPKKDTLNRIFETGAQLFRTDLQGNIIAYTDGKEITWNKIPCNDFRSGQEVRRTKNKKTKDKTLVKKEFILNSRTRKIHKKSCEAAAQIYEKNKKIDTQTLKYLFQQGYASCKLCKP